MADGSSSSCRTILTSMLTYHILIQNIIPPNAAFHSEYSQETCCFRRENLCHALKIHINRTDQLCRSVIPKLADLPSSGFYVDGGKSLTGLYYTILAMNIDYFDPTPLKYRQFNLLFVAWNIRPKCFQKVDAPCRPKQVWFSDAEQDASVCDHDFNRFDRVNLFLVQQSQAFSKRSKRLLTRENNQFADLYQSALFAGSPIRCNQYMIQRCSYNERYEHIVTKPKAEPYMTQDAWHEYHIEESRKILILHDTLLKHFPGVSVSRFSVDYEVDTCFLLMELENATLARKKSLETRKPDCSRSHRDWSNLSTREGLFETTMPIIRLANEWFLHARIEYVHHQAMLKYVTDMYSIQPELVTSILLKKREWSQDRMQRIVSRLVLFSELISQLHETWVPPTKYFKQADTT